MIHKLFNFTKLFKILKSLKISTLKKKVPPPVFNEPNH